MIPVSYLLAIISLGPVSGIYRRISERRLFVMACNGILATVGAGMAKSLDPRGIFGSAILATLVCQKVAEGRGIRHCVQEVLV
jgi:hypothetical protein